MKTKIKLAVLALLAATTGAGAADMPNPAVAYQAPASPAYNWTGFYIGAMGGYGWSTSQGIDFKGGFAGGTVGANWQMSNIVLGVEVEGAWSDIGQTNLGASDRIQAFGSATGRLGLAVDNFLIYGKGGFAAANNKLSLTALGLTLSDTQTHIGYTVGGGVEYGFAPNWSAKAEYLFAHYQSENYFTSIVAAGLPSGALEVHTVKFGINYRFGWNAPVTARY
jgi:outer membrane immunogenic protein